MSSFPTRASLRALMLAALLAPLPMIAQARQSGVPVRGTVAGPSGRAVPSARVVLVGTRYAALSDEQGAFTMANVAPGTYLLRATAPGYRTITQTITVRTEEPALLALAMDDNPVQLNAMVVSASRRAERLTDAPATITRIGPEVLENMVGNSYAAALKGVTGLDYIQTGMTSVAVNARGFNSSFNNRMLMLEDGRIAVLPENGLPVGQLTATPKVDLAGIEVLVGPGSALYGADASNGVIAMQSKDPRAYPGLTVEASGGSRTYQDVQARYAGARGNFGYKVAGEYQRAEDWANALTYSINLGAAGIRRVSEDSLRGNPVDFTSRAARGTAGLAYYLGAAKLELSGGMSRTDGVGQTNVGRNQLRDWGYNFLQARYSSPRVYLNAYRAQSTSGESFALNRYADAQARNANLSPDSLRMLSDWPSDGRIYAAEFQNNFIARPLRGTAVVWGAQLREDLVSSKRQWLTDRLTGSDVRIRQVGLYGQTTTRLANWLDVVLAGRVDDHQNYARQFSPKAGLVLRPAQGQALRLTYNRAFKSPTILQTNFWIPDWTSVISIYGNTQGFTVKDASGNVKATYEALRPERNTTWELGYKGVLGNRLFVDVTGYRSRYENFMSPLVVISNPFLPNGGGTFAYDGGGQIIRNEAGLTPLVLTYFNLGAAKLRGLDAGINYLLDRRFSLRGNASVTDLQEVEVPQGREEATALNAPATKWNVGADLRDVRVPFGELSAGATLRHVNRYYFRSGINMGQVPNLSTLDVNLGYRMPRLNSMLNVGVTNLFSCTGTFTYASSLPADDPRRGSDPLMRNPVAEQRGCGFNRRHIEMINMPEVGTMMFVGMQFQTR